MRELDVGKFTLDLNAKVFAFRSSVSREAEKILIAEMEVKLVEIGLERDGCVKAKVIDFASCFVGHLAEIILAKIDQAESMAAMSNTRIINAPEIDILALGSGNHRVQIRVERSPCSSAQEIDTGR